MSTSYPYLQELIDTASDPEKKPEDPEASLRLAKKEFEEVSSSVAEKTGVQIEDEDSGPDLSEAMKAAGKALPPSKRGDVTRQNVAGSTSAMAAFTRNLPDDMTPAEGLDRLESLHSQST